MAQEELFIGVDIGGTTTKIGAVDTAGNIYFKRSILTQEYSFAENFLEDLCELISSTIEDCNHKNSKVVSIGIGIPGIISKIPQNEIILIAPNVSVLCNVEIGCYLRNRFSLPIFIENDANAAAVAELCLGTGINYQNFIYITLGTGVGGSIIINKKIHTGATGAAGEIGHMLIINNSNYLNNFHDEKDYKTGTLEEFIGREKIIAIAKESLINFPNSSLSEIKNFDVKDISIAAEAGDVLSNIVLKKVGTYLGIAVVNISHLLDITNFIIGGGVSASKIILDSALSFAQRKAMPTVADKITIENATFLEETGIVGAAFLGIHSKLTN